MNTRPIIDESPGPIALSASFNTDNTCFSVGIDTGFCVYGSDPPSLRVSRSLSGGIAIAEMLGSYNYLALVGGGKSPRWPQTKVIIWDDAKLKEAVTLEHKTAVLRVRLTRTHIAVSLVNAVHLYAFTSPPTRLAVFETSDNPLGLCCLGTKLAVFPGRSPGKIQIVELKTQNVSIIPAHASALRALDLAPDESLLASASETGTLVRVFDASSCAKVAELRRGVDPAFVFSISFSPSAKTLAVTSDKATLHVFDLTQLTQNGDETQNKWGLFSKIPMLPRIFSDTYSFASVGFEMGDEAGQGKYLPSLGSLPARPVKGILGWADESTILMLGTGKDGRWERFRLGMRTVRQGNEDIVKRDIWKDGWKRYLGS